MLVVPAVGVSSPPLPPRTAEKCGAFSARGWRVHDIGGAELPIKRLAPQPDSSDKGMRAPTPKRQRARVLAGVGGCSREVLSPVITDGPTW